MSLTTSGWLFLVCFIFFKSENNTEIYAQVCKCDWTARRKRCVVITNDEPCEQNSLWRLKKSILYILPDILMFNMRVLYYHDDNDYSCAILVYCCLNVTLFFYGMMR